MLSEKWLFLRGPRNSFSPMSQSSPGWSKKYFVKNILLVQSKLRIEDKEFPRDPSSSPSLVSLSWEDIRETAFYFLEQQVEPNEQFHSKECSRGGPGYNSFTHWKVKTCDYIVLKTDATRKKWHLEMLMTLHLGFGITKLALSFRT
jgi:hypothetical protein